MSVALDLNPPQFPTAWAVAYGEDTYGLWQAFEINGLRQVMRWVEPGQCRMGSPADETGRQEDELLHTVTLSRGYWLADTACTQALWLAVNGENPSWDTTSTEKPVENVSWHDCVAFVSLCNDLMEPASVPLRLPTEAEWEYACRAGTDTAYWWGNEFDDTHANNGMTTLEVLNYAPNGHGLFQMHGNVLEWCADWYGEYPVDTVRDPVGLVVGQRRVLRGGCWIGVPRALRSAYRDHRGPDSRSRHFGFRLAGG